jgi:sugar-specific transcriptional regulator TrmB
MEGKIRHVKLLLMDMGLNEYQASALASLLYLGETKASILSRASGVPRVRIYGILEELARRGLIRIKPGRPVMFSPMPPREIVTTLIAEARDEMRRRLEALEGYSEELLPLIEEIYLKGGRVEERPPLLRIVSVGEASLEETRRLYRAAKRSIRVLTRAMEYFPEVEKELREAVSRGVELKIIMMSSRKMKEEDRKKRDEMMRRMREALSGNVEIRMADEVVMRGCIVDPEMGGKALFLVEEVGVPFFLREAAITSHPSVVKGLTTLFDLMWRYDTYKPE